MNNNDFDFISSKFDEENIKAPESLSAENVIKDFDNKNVNNIVKLNKNTRWIKSAVALVACFAVVITGVIVIKPKVEPIYQPGDTSIEGVSGFGDYSELENKLEKIMVTNTGSSRFFFKKSYTKDFAVEENGSAADATGEKGLTSKAGNDYAKTNKQVEDVDEADIVKTDGKYIYYIPAYGSNTVKIYSADNGKTKLVSEIKPKSEASFSEMFILKNKLIVIGMRNSYNYLKSYDATWYTFVNTYDISNAEKPKLINEYEQNGSYSTARLVDGTVYVVSDFYKYFYSRKNEIEDFVPCATGKDGKTEKLPIKSIYCIDGCKRPGYAVVGAVSIDGKSSKTNTKALLGASNNVYCNEKNLYLASSDFDYRDYESKSITRIVKYAFDKTDVELSCVGEVEGSTNDQFSFDEKDGNLRVATTIYDYADDKNNINCLYVLDKRLKEIGEVKGFAMGEHIEAVRFIGNTAYVITFETTDPLFVIDLTNPKKPRITGEVKIDGFSSTLTPVDENTLLGIGYTTFENEFGGVQTDGLKIVLFDISDKNKPKVLSEKELRSCNSEIQNDHRALVINKDKGYFAIPVNVYNEYEETGTVAIIRTDNRQLDLKELKCDSYDVARCTYIGDYVYALSGEGTENLQSFKVMRNS